jgi:hypothetical protein
MDIITKERMELIGLTGSKFHGKDSVADLVHKYSTNKIVRLSFAEPIKRALSIIHVVPYSVFEDPKLKEVPLPQWENRTPRQLAQWLGTDIYRNQFDQDVWLKNMKMRIDKYCGDDDTTVIITDCRFDNEAEFIKKLGGTVWLVDACARVGVSGDGHVSEKGVSMDYVGRVVDNNGSFVDLDNYVCGLFSETS